MRKGGNTGLGANQRHEGSCCSTEVIQKRSEVREERRKGKSQGKGCKNEMLQIENSEGPERGQGVQIPAQAKVGGGTHALV